MNKKFNKILHLQKEKIKKGFEKSANFAKVTTIFLAMREDWVTNRQKYKNKKINNILHLEREKVKKGFEKSANFAK